MYSLFDVFSKIVELIGEKDFHSNVNIVKFIGCSFVGCASVSGFGVWNTAFSP